MSSATGRSSYLDEDAGSIDSAARRLALAEDADRAPAERLRVLADVGRFLDEFFQLTGAGLRAASAVPGRGDGVRHRVEWLLARHSAALERTLAELRGAGVELRHWADLDDDDRRAAAAIFEDRVRPVVVPLTAEPGKPLPPPANLSVNLAAVIRDAEGRSHLGLVELPPVIPRFLRLPATSFDSAIRFVPVEDVVEAHLGALFPETLFPGARIEAGAAFRVTRQAGIVANPDADDLLSSVERQLRLERHGMAVRLEVRRHTPAHVIDRLAGELDLRPGEIYAVGRLLGTADLDSLPLPADRADARPDAARKPAAPPRIGGPAEGRRPADVFDVLDRGDVLVHFPYESYADSVVALLNRAAADPALLAIKQTLYRARPDGPTVRALVRAAERGAHVVAVVELTARLDERASVACARALERAGAHVVYGLVGLRTHCPLTLVIRGGVARVSRYGVVGTGLHHPDRRPEGMSLLTAAPAVTADLADVFNYLTGYSRPGRYRKLLVGPGHLRSRLLDLIRQETAAGPAGRIALKVYRLVDREVIDALYRAAQQGVPVDLVVSGACALRPGVPGLSEGIRVVAPLGRHFETSRLFGFGFGTGEGDASSWYVSSGDLALAHLDRQIDVAVPVDDQALRSRLDSMIDVLLRNAAWEMDSDGSWHRCGPGADAGLRALAASSGTLGGEG